MTQPLGRSEWPVAVVGPPPPPASPALPIEKVTRDIEGLPDPGARSIRLTPVVAGIEPTADSGVAAARLDAFMLRATPTFRTAEGSVTVSIGFYMSTTPTPPPRPGFAPILARAGISREDAILVTLGRASSDVAARVTQALLDANAWPPQDWLAAHRAPGAPPSREIPLATRVRELMLYWHVGSDCANYVTRATLAVRNISRTDAGFATPALESLSRLPTQGYVKLAPGAPLRTGDVIALHPDAKNFYGHRVIVRDAAPASPSEIAQIRERWSLQGAARTSAAWDRVVVDSSWGSGAWPALGGVERRTWWHDRTTGTWAYADQGSVTGAGVGPDGHSSFDVFRSPGSP
jgi:hypothetical protein